MNAQSHAAMPHVSVTRYANPRALGWAGYIEPADASWILYVGLDGRAMAFLHRDPETGAILPNDPAEHEAHLATLRRDDPGLRIGMRSPAGDGYREGERVIPLGECGGGGDVVPAS